MISRRATREEMDEAMAIAAKYLNAKDAVAGVRECRDPEHNDGNGGLAFEAGVGHLYEHVCPTCGHRTWHA